jgi:hypothetical protein
MQVHIELSTTFILDPYMGVSKNWRKEIYMYAQSHMFIRSHAYILQISLLNGQTIRKRIYALGSGPAGRV